MTAMKARARLGSAKKIVVKIGSHALADKRGGLDRAVFKSVAGDVAALKDAGKSVAIVSSGAILAGRSRLGLMGRELNIPQKQAAAAVGQNELMAHWARAFGRFQIETGQVLLTAEDLGDRGRFLNSRNTMEELLRLRVVPVINENDTVAVEEIRYGDNDFLSTLVVSLMQADLLIILTDIAGLCAEDPAQNPAAPVLSLVMESDTGLFACAGPSHSGVGSGGMATKIEAARTAARRGVPTVIANAKTPSIIARIVKGEEMGTLFVPEGRPLKEKKYWMAFAGEAKGRVTVDDGARRALEERGKSLLPSGVTEVSGEFVKGDVVEVADANGREIARGLTQYSGDDLARIKGRKSSEIAAVLGEKLYDEVIHRDDLVLTGKR
ncbi:MAG TPA: glutamate 5-kinase [bacterium]|nr:glutamate 5-kinase [bacterium]